MSVHKQFSHLSSEQLLAYYRHDVSEQERQVIEEHLLQCDFCSDALTGISNLKDVRQMYRITHELKSRLKRRTLYTKKIFSRNDWIVILSAFFIIGLILLIAFYFFIVRW